MTQDDSADLRDLGSRLISSREIPEFARIHSTPDGLLELTLGLTGLRHLRILNHPAIQVTCRTELPKSVPQTTVLDVLSGRVTTSVYRVYPATAATHKIYNVIESVPRYKDALRSLEVDLVRTVVIGPKSRSSSTVVPAGIYHTTTGTIGSALVVTRVPSENQKLLTTRVLVDLDTPDLELPTQDLPLLWGIVQSILPDWPRLLG